MSADHYSICPKCRVALIDSLPELPESLREDYEFYLQGEVLSISYSAGCSKCRFQYNFSKEINILKSEDNVMTD